MADYPVIERALDSIEWRDHDNGTGTLTGHFAVFNRSTVINSFWEGNFRERIAPGAFNRTIEQRRDQIRCIYEHGRDPSFGNKPLGAISALREDERGAFYEVELFDNQLNRDHIIQPARAGQLGASFAFEVLSEEWDDTPEDEGLPIRTIREVRLHEFGPCPFPAYADATADVRSALRNSHLLTADQRQALHQFAPLATDLDTAQTEDGAGCASRDDAPSPNTPDSAAGHAGLTPGERQRLLRELTGALNK